MAENEDRPFRYDMALPGPIHTFENRIWGPFSVRDAIAVALVAILAAAGTAIFPSVVLKVIVALAIGIPGMVLALYHLVTDADRLEVVIRRMIAFYLPARELTWRKTMEDGGAYEGDTTQQLYRMFDIDPQGFLIFRDGGGAALIHVDGSDYDLRKGNEQQALIGSWLGFLDGLAGGGGEGWPVQILVKSMPLDLSEEIEANTARLRRMPADSPLRTPMRNHIAHLQERQDAYGTFEMKYYIVVPYLREREGFGRSTLGFSGGLAAEQLRADNPLSRMLRRKEKSKALLDLEATGQSFDRKTTAEVLRSRTSHVLGLLESVQGLSCRPAKTEEYVELMYYFFNPASSKMKYVLQAGARENLASYSPEVDAIAAAARGNAGPAAPAEGGRGQGLADITSLLGR